MRFILAGMASYVFFLLFDWADMRRFILLKAASVLCAVGLMGFALVGALMNPQRFVLPLALRIAGGVLGAGFLLLLVFSVFLEIPFRQAYGGEGGKRRLVRTGTYALSRHPGVLWFFFFHVCLAVASESWLLLAAVPFWNGMNVLLVAAEDGVFFPRTFGEEYRDYQRSVPFLIPTPASLRRCLSTFRHGG